MVKTHSTYRCETCGTEYATWPLAEACEAQPEPAAPGVSVGAYVAGGGYGWWKQDAAWALTDSTPWPAPGARSHHPRYVTQENPAPKFARYRGDPKDTPCAVRAASWAPIFRVAGFVTVPPICRTSGGFMRHEAQRIVGWSPRHMNRQNGAEPGSDLAAPPGSLRMEAFGYMSGSGLVVLLNPDLWPDTDDEQEERFRRVAAYVAAGGRVEYFGGH
ncbi:hypothetical protein TMCBR2_gp043c [Caulobacter phage TMCBR2]|uniref:Uncharacterized protein n=1 Tax=Caulobacter phage TMCBR2 TaxID=3025404 RepID=A0AAE9YBG9_9CAUD|nr:hypothetical protein TMCBR2_gp043c [Caulobacter phage TMCBR2]